LDIEISNDAPSAAPLSPAGSEASPTTITDDRSPDLSWTYSDPENDAQSAYALQVYDAAGNLVWEKTKTVSAATSYPLPGGVLEYGQLYRWRVKVWDAYDAESEWSDFGWFVCELSAPTGLAATPDGANAEIDLSWSAHPGEGLAGYNLYQSIDGGGTWERVNTELITGTAYADRYVKSGTAMTYRLTAVADDGYESGYSGTASATVTVAGAWLQDRQVVLRCPARAGARRERLASARLALDGTWQIQDRGYGPAEVQLEIVYQSVAEREALRVLFTAGADVYYRDATGDRFRGRVTAPAQCDEVYPGCGFWSVALSEVTVS